MKWKMRSPNQKNMTTELNTKLLFESAEEFWSDNSGRLAMATRAVAPIGQTIINGRLFELQLVMTSKIDEIQFPSELIV